MILDLELFAGSKMLVLITFIRSHFQKKKIIINLKIKL